MGAIFVFCLGLIFGSFANVVALRLNTGESLIFGGSRCFLCSHRLRWFEMIPIISYFMLHGRCRSCGGAVSLQYPIIELASGLLFVLLYMSKVEPWLWITIQGSTLDFAFAAAFFWLLLVLSVYDFWHQILPDSLVAIAAVIAFAALIAGSIFGSPTSEIWKLDFRVIAAHVLAGSALFLFFASLWFFSRGRWMGLGDAKLAFAIGLFLGWPASLVALFLSFWVGAVVGIGWVLYRRLQTLKIPIPFGPFLAAGALGAYFWGTPLIEWYLRLVI